MVSNYKILRKANLVDDLFVGEVDEAAITQEQADRDWARDQDADVVDDIATAQPAPVALRPAGAGPNPAAQLVEAEALVEAEPPQSPESKALVRVSPERGWTQILADLTQNPNLEGIRYLGVCGLDRASGASDAVATLARWVAERSEKPVLLVEAHFRTPRLAVKFDVEDTGVSDVLLDGKRVDDAIQQPVGPNLVVLVAGAPFGWFSRGKAVSAFPSLFVSLRERFDPIIVELPAADDPLLAKLPIASLADAVILVADPKTTPPGKLSRGTDRLRDANAPLAAAMLCSTEGLSDALRRDRLANKVQPNIP